MIMTRPTSHAACLAKRYQPPLGDRYAHHPASRLSADRGTVRMDQNRRRLGQDPPSRTRLRGMVLCVHRNRLQSHSHSENSRRHGMSHKTPPIDLKRPRLSPRRRSNTGKLAYPSKLFQHPARSGYHAARDSMAPLAAPASKPGWVSPPAASHPGWMSPLALPASKARWMSPLAALRSMFRQ
jgi:hypothetical protein